MTTDKHNLSRRQALVGIGLAAAIVPVAGVSIAKAGPGDRTAWDMAMADHLRAVAASDAFDARINAITNAYRKTVEKVPHTTLRPDPYTGHTTPITTADEWFVARARRHVAEVDAGKCWLDPAFPSLHEHLQLCRDVVAAADARDAEIKRIDERTGYSAGHEHYDALTTAICDTETVLLNMPAPDGEALFWKVERLYSPGEGIWAAGVEDQTYADLRRFLLNGRA